MTPRSEELLARLRERADRTGAGRADLVDVERALPEIEKQATRPVRALLEAALTPTGDHHRLPSGYCLDCQGQHIGDWLPREAGG